MTASEQQTHSGFKIVLPGERVWAEIIKSVPNGWLVRIINETVATNPKIRAAFEAQENCGPLPQLHNVKYGDEVIIVEGSGNYAGEWIVAGIEYPQGELT